jgi:acyl-CoA reductase-like NAD-dependent aldehyde dehydrogenase
METTAVATAQTQWIGGRSVPSHGTETLPIRDPSNLDHIVDVPRGDPADAAAAVEAAVEAGREWAALSPPARAVQLREAARKMQACRDEVARLLTRENGKPLAESYGELDASVGLTNQVAEIGIYLDSRHLGSQAGDLVFQRWEPRGVAACISVWNFPVIASVELAVCNLMVGNTVVLKSSEKTPLATQLLFERVFDHLPPGAVNHLNGDGPTMGEPIVRHPDVDIVCFIGSLQVGRHIGRIAGERVLKVILELGGKDAFIVDDTVDPGAVARLAARCSFANSGQICTSTERIYVQSSVRDAFVENLVNAAKSLKVGPGLDPSTEMGPMIDETQLSRVQQHVDSAVHAGAEVLAGGGRLDRPGFFYPPTVLANVTDDTALMYEETFGPVAPVVKVDSFEEAIERANATEYGLSAIVCTESASRAMAAIEKLKAGMIKINTERGQAPGAPAEPFKGSGLGIGHGIEFLRELTVRKSVHWRARIDA